MFYPPKYQELKSPFASARVLVSLLFCILSLTTLQVLAANNSQFEQTISAGSLSVDIIDGSSNSVANPSVTFSALPFDFDTQDSTGTLGTSSEILQVYNPTSTPTWTVNIAGSASTGTWTDGGPSAYDFNDPSGYTDGADADSVGGQLTIDPSVGTLVGVSGCSTTNVSKGSSDSFSEGVVNNIDILTASSGADTFCKWNLTDVSLTQKIPAAQTPGSYTFTMNLTIN